MRTTLDRQVEQFIEQNIDLSQWVELPGEERIRQLRELVQELKELCGVTVELCFTMPPGFEMANGLYDPIKRISYLNLEMPGVGPVEQLFLLLHEFRHAEQNSRQELFSPELVKGLRYVIQYDGTCYRQHNGELQQTKLEGEQAYYTELYLAQHHERDANEFARDCLLSARNSQPFHGKIQKYFSMWSPPYVQFAEGDAAIHLSRAYEQIDRNLG